MGNQPWSQFQNGIQERSIGPILVQGFDNLNIKDLFKTYNKRALLPVIKSPCIMCVQYRGGAQYRGGVQYRGGYHEYRGGIS